MRIQFYLVIQRLVQAAEQHRFSLSVHAVDAGVTVCLAIVAGFNLSIFWCATFKMYNKSTIVRTKFLKMYHRASKKTLRKDDGHYCDSSDDSEPEGFHISASSLHAALAEHNILGHDDFHRAWSAILKQELAASLIEVRHMVRKELADALRVERMVQTTEDIAGAKDLLRKTMQTTEELEAANLLLEKRNRQLAAENQQQEEKAWWACAERYVGPLHDAELRDEQLHLRMVGCFPHMRPTPSGPLRRRPLDICFFQLPKHHAADAIWTLATAQQRAALSSAHSTYGQTNISE